MSVMGRRVAAKHTAVRAAQDTELVADVAADVLTGMFTELLLEALKEPEVRSAVRSVLAGATRRPNPPTPLRAAAVKAGRRRG